MPSISEIYNELIQILSDCYEMHDIKGRRNTLVRRCFTPRLRAQVEKCRDEDPMSDLCCIVECAEKFGVLDKLIEEAIKLIDDQPTKDKLAAIPQNYRRVARKGDFPQEQAESKKKPSDSSESPIQHLKADVLFVTVTKVEARAVLELVKEKFSREPEIKHIGHKTYYDLGTIGGAKTFMVRSEMGTEGPSGATMTISEAIRELSPSAVIMVGIAFGIDEEKQNIGDVLVSRQLLGYDLQRVSTGPGSKPEIILRSDRPSASPRLLDRFRDGELNWEEAAVRFGPILSGQKLVDNVDFRNQLRKFGPEAVGGEMEGIGLYSAAELHKVDWIMAKAICDWADGKKHENKSQRQEVAARNAASFTIHVIEQGGLVEGGAKPSSDTSCQGAEPPEREGKTQQECRNELYEILTGRFSKAELKTLCFRLGVDYDNIGGDTLPGKAEELIRHFERRNRVPELIEQGKRDRPDITGWPDISCWEDMPGPSQPPQQPEQAQQSRQTITWLHISDLHFSESQDYNAHVVLQELLLDVGRCLQEHDLHLDFIAVTGDIAFSGQPGQYAQAKRFFGDLLAKTSLQKERLFVVPGNHDIDRKLVSKFVEDIGAALTDRDKVNKLLFESPDERRLVLKRFKGYAAFINDYFAGHLDFDDERFVYTRTLDIAGRTIALLGLNSAWLCASDKDEALKLALGERQTRTALKQAEGAGLKITLLHHPFDWLREFDRGDSEALLRDNCDFVLHGHLHRSAMDQLTSPDSGAMVIAGGACYKTREYPNSYNFVRLDLSAGTGDVYLRRYSDERGGFWAKDVLTYRNVPDGMYTFALRESMLSQSEPS